MYEPLTLPDAFSAAECDAIIVLANEAGLADAGLVRGDSDSSIRRAEIGWLDDAGPAAWVLDRVTGLVSEANRHFAFVLEGFEERLQAARYRAGSLGHFGWHSDCGTGPLAARRKLTLVVQLSPPGAYAGGLLECWTGHQPVTAPRARGTAIAFPSFALHRVTDVTEGERWSLTTWVHGQAFR